MFTQKIIIKLFEENFNVPLYYKIIANFVAVYVIKKFLCQMTLAEDNWHQMISIDVN